MKKNGNSSDRTIRPTSHKSCSRVDGMKIVKAEVKIDYLNSEPQIYVPEIGTLARTGLCSRCDAPIYRREVVGKNYPHNLTGPYYHAVRGGLACLFSE